MVSLSQHMNQQTFYQLPQRTDTQKRLNKGVHLTLLVRILLISPSALSHGPWQELCDSRYIEHPLTPTHSLTHTNLTLSVRILLISPSALFMATIFICSHGPWHEICDSRYIEHPHTPSSSTRTLTLPS